MHPDLFGVFDFSTWAWRHPGNPNGGDFHLNGKTYTSQRNPITAFAEQALQAAPAPSALEVSFEAEGDGAPAAPLRLGAAEAEACTLTCKGGAVELRVYGLQFFWPMQVGATNPYFRQTPRATDVIVAHGPAKGCGVDGGSGCPDLAAVAERLGLAGALRLVVSGHIHHAHGVARRGPVVHVNAANAKKGHADMGWEAIVVDV